MSICQVAIFGSTLYMSSYINFIVLPFAIHMFVEPCGSPCFFIVILGKGKAVVEGESSRAGAQGSRVQRCPTQEVLGSIL